MIVQLVQIIIKLLEKNNLLLMGNIMDLVLLVQQAVRKLIDNWMLIQQVIKLQLMQQQNKFKAR